MSNIEKLKRKLSVADKKWTKAVFSPRYPEDEDKPLTEDQKSAWRWANVWRRVVHDTETALRADPSIREGLLENAVAREDPTFYEAMIIPAMTSASTRKSKPFIPPD